MSLQLAIHHLVLPRRQNFPHLFSTQIVSQSNFVFAEMFAVHANPFLCVVYNLVMRKIPAVLFVIYF